MFYRINQLRLAHLLWMSVLMVVGCTPSAILPTRMILPTEEPSTPTPPLSAFTQTATPTQTLTPAPTVALAAVIPSATLTETVTATQTPTLTATQTPTLAPTLTATDAPTLQSDAIVNNAQGLFLRKGPHVAFEPPITFIEDQIPLTLLAISPNMLWYKVRTLQGQEGWAYSKLLKIYREPELSVMDVPLPTAQMVIVINSASVASLPIAAAGAPALITNAESISARTLEIYQYGLQQGNNPRMIAKVGDSITSNQDFLLGYGTGHYNLGAYGLLQDSVNYFSSEAFRRDSVAAEPGFSTASLLDPMSAPQDICLPNESPLVCEYRLTRPAVSIILLGSVDVQRYDANTFRSYLSQVVDITVSQGIVPVLTTFTYAQDYYPAESEAFNNVIRSIAMSQQIPLIDLQAATVNMSNRGVGTDLFHLTQRSDDWIYLDGEQDRYGTTMRNFITLKTLDNLRRGLGMQ